jgi:lipopolysaccharide/colanic/teichoic acid biosynthesis glycosyltransferase
MLDRIIKRTTDIVGAVVGLIILSPLLLTVAILIARNLGRPVLFRQKRGGLHSRPFHLVKFRTMTDAVGPDGRPRPDEERLTSFGRWLRELSIDELPSLWNVLVGDMSLVGPRPFIYDYVAIYTPVQARRHEVRPGLTGWAQVNGRNAISWDDKFQLDVWYVDHRSFWLDSRILLLTVKKVFVREGISAAGSVTMERFMGSLPAMGNGESGHGADELVSVQKSQH